MPAPDKVVSPRAPPAASPQSSPPPPAAATAARAGAGVSTVGDLRSVVASQMEDLKRHLDALHSCAHADLDASFSRVSKRIKAKYKQIIAEAQSSTTRDLKMHTGLELMSMQPADDWFSFCFDLMHVRESVLLGQGQFGATYLYVEQDNESLKWPGFVEFHDVNGEVLAYYSAQHGIYEVLDLKNYYFLYSISLENVQEIKIRLCVMPYLLDAVNKEERRRD